MAVLLVAPSNYSTMFSQTYIMATECTTKRCSLCMRIGQPMSVTRRSREYVRRTIRGAPFESVVSPRWTKELCSYCDAFVEVRNCSCMACRRD